VWASALLLSGAVALAGQAPGAPAAKPVPAAAAKAATPTSPGAGPVVVVETDKGVFEFETYPNEAPKTVAHILALIKRNFYNGQRVHRYEPGFVFQFGDQQTRDMTKRAYWGSAGSGKPIGVGEMHPKRTHRLGAVAMAHQPDMPETADSQIYVVLSEARARSLNGKYTVFGQVISGMPVVQKINLLTNIKRVSVRPETAAK
jgi:cyclophilin family peptidyl-prolyl cis-trans isomerase